MKLFVKHSCTKQNFYRSIKVALVVGSVLAGINHYDMFISREWEIRRFFQIAITYFVPFFVSFHGGGMFGRYLEKKGII